METANPLPAPYTNQPAEKPTNSISWSIVALVLIIILAVAIAAFSAGYFFFSQKERNLPNTAIPSQIQEKIYKSHYFGYEFSYPAILTLQEKPILSQLNNTKIEEITLTDPHYSPQLTQGFRITISVLFAEEKDQEQRVLLASSSAEQFRPMSELSFIPESLALKFESTASGYTQFTPDEGQKIVANIMIRRFPAPFKHKNDGILQFKCVGNLVECKTIVSKILVTIKPPTI